MQSEFASFGASHELQINKGAKAATSLKEKHVQRAVAAQFEVTMGIRIAVLMTAHNRRRETIASLAALCSQHLEVGVSVDVYLVDDGSSDGTADAVRKHYPFVRVLNGTGDLYWNWGMRLAFAHAVKGDYDYHLWLNDDTRLYPNAVDVLLKTSREVARASRFDAMISGSTRDPESLGQTSGGLRYRSHPVLMRFQWVEPSSQSQCCDATAGNCVLVPRAIYRALGNLSPNFRHFLGDIDYGLRAIEKDFTIWVPPGYVADCVNQRECAHQLHELRTLGDLLNALGHPKGLSLDLNSDERLLPIKEWTVFLRYHVPFCWPIPWVLSYRKLATAVARRYFTARS